MSFYLDVAPFFHKREDDEEGGYTVDFKGIAHALVVAAIIGVAIMYNDQSKIITRLDSIGSDIEEIRNNQATFRADFYSPMHKRKN